MQNSGFITITDNQHKTHADTMGIDKVCFAKDSPACADLKSLLIKQDGP